MRRITLKKLLTLLVLPLAVVAFNSCIFDAAEDSGPPVVDPPLPFKPLKERDDVLFNVRLAYVQRNVDEYNKLLDDNFTFFFSPQDVIDNKVSAAQWGRLSELTSAGHMFDPTFDPAGDTEPIGSISLSLDFPPGEDSWNPQIDELVHPGEIWYEKTISYLLVVIAGNTTFTNANPIDASFVIRFTEAGGDSIYRLASWKDDF